MSTRDKLKRLGHLNRITTLRVAAAILVAVGMLSAAGAVQAQSKPNILVIFGDDVGQSNISRYTRGLMGYKTPNIDSIGEQGITFTDYYAENSCTAGRSSFITGQSPVRTGLSKVGVPGATVGLQKRDITIAEALKPLGYATGQFGKNHLGDRDEYLPTAHGFDEFYGNLYHLNAEQEPEMPYWPKDDAVFLKVYAPRGVLHSFADGKIEDTGPLTMKRMETIDDETTSACMNFMEQQVKAGKPFFTWMNFTRMHVFTHVRPEYIGKAGLGKGYEYADGMWEMDQNVGKLLKKLDDLHITDNTIVLFTTDNGPNMFTWPDAAMSPFRNEKDSPYEGAFRVPAVIRWPGHIKPDQWSNEIVSGQDWFPTFLAAAGNPNIKEELLKGTGPGGMAHKVHLDGYNLLPYLTGQEQHSPRKDFFYFDDDGLLVAVRHENWKFIFCEQRKPGGYEVWSNPLTCLRIPRMYNLRMDPYERAELTSDQYNDWQVHNAYLMFQGGMVAQAFMDTFKDYPPSQLPQSFTIDPEGALKEGEAAYKAQHK
jgi:arylsulfatase A-like enzyme